MQILPPRPLSEFLEASDQVSDAVLAEGRAGVRLVREVDTLIRERLFGVGEIDINIFAMNLAFSCYFSFLASIRVALSGHATAVYPLIRQMLEFACYAYLIAEDPARGEVWLARHNSDDERMACRKAFSSAVAEVSKSINERAPNFGDRVRDIYDSSIDFGAHPNPRAVFDHLRYRDEGKHVRVESIALYDKADIAVQRALVACAETGITAVFVIALAAKNHPLIDERFTAFETFQDHVFAAEAELLGANPNLPAARA